MALPLTDSVALVLDAGNGTLTDEFVSGLTQGGSWTFGAGPRVLTWSLNINELTGSYPGTPVPGPGGEWVYRPDMAAAVASVLSRWASVADIQFQKINSGQYYFESSADLAVTLTGNDLDNVFGLRIAGAAHFPDADLVEETVYSDISGINRVTYPTPEGDVFLDNFEPLFEFSAPGGQGYAVILHEIGHALGLKHPFDDGDNAGRPTFADLGIEDMDRMRYTVMSYDIVNQDPAAQGFVATPMPLDILAIQSIYGANMSYHTGDDTYSLTVGSFRAIWDAGGGDALSAASWTRAGGALIDLREGEYSGLLAGARRTAIAYGVTIEDAVGSGAADRLIGNGARNFLDGGAGGDALFGGPGGDRLRGGAGSDRMEGEAGNDLLVYSAGDALLAGGAGLDTLRIASGGLDLRAVVNTQVTGIERINMTGAGDNRLTLDARAVLDLSPGSNILRVLGDAGDTVDIAGPYVDQGITGDYHRYRLGAAVLLVDTDVTVS